MATPPEKPPNPPSIDDDEEKEPAEENGNGGEDEDLLEKFVEDEDEEEEEEEDDADDEATADKSPAAQRERLQTLFRRLSSGPVRLRVHDVVIKGNARTKDAVIEAEVMDAFRSTETLQDLFQAAGAANARLQGLEIFESVKITLDAGPPELPGTANVVIEIVEPKNPLTGEIGVYTRQEAKAWELEGSLKLKNPFGYADIWDLSGGYGWDQATDISAGLSLPRFKALRTPLSARVSLSTQDWLKFSSYKEHLLGFSLGLLSTRHHDLSYNLTWRHLTDPSHMSSPSIRRQLGHSLLSAVKYTYKIDHRDSQLRPTRGYAFQSTSQVGGLCPDSKSLRFIRQEFDLRAAFPLGFYHTALNVGVAAGAIMPWGKGFMSSPSPLPYRFFMGGNSSPMCSLGGVASLLGFKTRGLGPTDSRRPTSTDSDGGRDALGGDVAVTVFADLSFDLPLKLFRAAGIHGHVFTCAGNLADLKDFSLQKFKQTFRSCAGLGLIIPTKIFRMEINYCYILRQLEYDRGKTGIQFNFSPAR